MDLFQVDVFTDVAYGGNPLAVFPDAPEPSTRQMQAIAREMNLSETVFVRSCTEDSYEVRIFTPDTELPFAGHPTLGSAWVLRQLGRLKGTSFTQRSPAGETPISADGERLWFERAGAAGADLEHTDVGLARKLAAALRLEQSAIGLEARELGRPGVLRPALSDAGLEQMMVPLRHPDALAACRPSSQLVAELLPTGLYCFTATRAGYVRARGFFPAIGIDEDPATGSAAAALGIYLADRVGAIDLEIEQGIEMGRPSKIHIGARVGRVRVGGDVVLVFRGRLEVLP